MPKHLYENAEVIYCAESLDAAWELYTADTGIERADDDGEAFDPFKQIADDHVMEVGSEETPEDENQVYEKRGHYYFWTLPAGKWAEQSRIGLFSGGE